MDALSMFGGTPSILKDPFSKDCIDGIRIVYSKGLVTNTPYFEGSVSFKNGNTSGKQQFEGNSLVDVFNQVYKFCNSL